LPDQNLGVANLRKNEYESEVDRPVFRQWSPSDSYSRYAPKFAVTEALLILSVGTSETPTKGAGIFTTSINLSAGTETSGNLAEGAKVYWSISGIMAEDLESGELEGSGIIADGILEIEHSLVEDNDSGESFDISVFSDAERKQQIGETNEFAIADKSPAPVIRGDIAYALIFKDHPRYENPTFGDLGFATNPALAWYSWGSNNQNTYREELFSLSQDLGGSIATINSQQKYDFLEYHFKNQVSFSAWVYLPGDIIGIAKFRRSEYEAYADKPAFRERSPADSYSGYAPEFAVVEIPLNLSTNIPSQLNEAESFVLNIKLTTDVSDTTYTEEAQLWYQIEGVQESDFTNDVALSGQGEINEEGKFVLEGLDTPGITLDPADDSESEDKTLQIRFYSEDPSGASSNLKEIQIGETLSSVVNDAYDPLRLPSKVKLKDKGKTPFVLYGNEELEFDLGGIDSLINPKTIGFGSEAAETLFSAATKRKGGIQASYEDYNGDNYLDYVVKVYTADI
jgi:hypothetical protein